MIVTYTAIIAFPVPTSGEIRLTINGCGDDEKACKRDAQAQVRKAMKAIGYHLEAVKE